MNRWKKICGKYRQYDPHISYHPVPGFYMWHYWIESEFISDYDEYRSREEAEIALEAALAAQQQTDNPPIPDL